MFENKSIDSIIDSYIDHHFYLTDSHVEHYLGIANLLGALASSRKYTKFSYKSVLEELNGKSLFKHAGDEQAKIFYEISRLLEKWVGKKVEIKSFIKKYILSENIEEDKSGLIRCELLADQYEKDRKKILNTDVFTAYLASQGIDPTKCYDQLCSDFLLNRSDYQGVTYDTLMNIRIPIFNQKIMRDVARGIKKNHIRLPIQNGYGFSCLFRLELKNGFFSREKIEGIPAEIISFIDKELRESHKSELDYFIDSPHLNDYITGLGLYIKITCHFYDVIEILKLIKRWAFGSTNYKVSGMTIQPKRDRVCYSKATHTEDEWNEIIKDVFGLDIQAELRSIEESVVDDTKVIELSHRKKLNGPE